MAVSSSSFGPVGAGGDCWPLLCWPLFCWLPWFWLLLPDPPPASCVFGVSSLVSSCPTRIPSWSGLHSLARRHVIMAEYNAPPNGPGPVQTAGLISSAAFRSIRTTPVAYELDHDQNEPEHTTLRCESEWERVIASTSVGGGTHLYRYSIGYEYTPSQAPCYDLTQPLQSRHVARWGDLGLKWPIDGSLMERISGIGVSPGIVVGRVFVLDDEKRRIRADPSRPPTVKKQLERLETAVDLSACELERVREQAEQDMGHDAAQIFSFHIGMLRDRVLLDAIESMITAELVTAEHAVDAVLNQWADRFRAMPDSAFTTKVNDITDIADRVLVHLVGEHGTSLAEIEDGAIVVAAELTPSQTLGLTATRSSPWRPTLVAGRATLRLLRGRSRSRRVVGLGTLCDKLCDGDVIIIDGGRGVVIVDPDDETIEHYLSEEVVRGQHQMSLREMAKLEPITTDGVKIEVLGNIEFAEEVGHVLDYGGEGVGSTGPSFCILRASASRPRMSISRRTRSVLIGSVVGR